MFSDKASINALAAARTWQIVTSGFFSRQALGLAGEEQMTDLSDPRVPQDLAEQHGALRAIMGIEG